MGFLNYVYGVVAEVQVSDAISGALNGVKDDALNVIAKVAPIALSIAGAFMVWRLGIRFFKSIAK